MGIEDIIEALKNSLPGNSHFDKAILTTLKREGGFVNDPADPGGATNWGISLRYLKQRGDADLDGVLDGDLDNDGDIDIDDIKMMIVDQAIDLYRSGFWDKYSYDELESYDVAEKIFDMTVNMGANQTGKIVQRALQYLGFNVAVDGVIGPNTRKAINKADEEKLLPEIRYQQAKFYLDLIEQKPTLAKFRNGWLRRACG